MKANKTKIYLLMADACIEMADLEKKSDMPRSTLNKVISGKAVRPVTMGKLAKALGVNVSEIMQEGE